MPPERYSSGAFAYPGGARMLLPDPAPDGEIYVTTAQAAQAMGRQPPAIRRWVKLGRLPESAPGIYRLSDVAAAEQLAREAAIRTTGSDTRPQPRYEAALQGTSCRCLGSYQIRSRDLVLAVRAADGQLDTRPADPGPGSAG
jgi:hypothetical protein